PRPAAASTLRPRLTLVIDDDPDARTVLGQQLIDLGCDVVYAATADDGIVLARRVRPDLVTLDVMMPMKGGIEALREFKAAPDLRDIPVVLVSVVAEDYRGRVFGAVDCLEKPVTREALADVLRRTAPGGGPAVPPRILVVRDAGAADETRADLALPDGARVDVALGLADARAMIAAHGAPSAIVLDLPAAGTAALDWLSGLRDTRSTFGVPVVVALPATPRDGPPVAPRPVGSSALRDDHLRADLLAVLQMLRPAGATQGA
ncbi:MAG: response regulator, partial [Gemmatimonadota bacterium]|nr:response regulator [Gemmatimonadota bacterium]